MTFAVLRIRLQCLRFGVVDWDVGFLFSGGENTVPHSTVIVYPKRYHEASLDDIRPDNPERGGVTFVQVCL